MFYYNVLKSPRDKLQKSVMKNRGFYLKNSQWPWPDLDNSIKDQTDN